MSPLLALSIACISTVGLAALARRIGWVDRLDAEDAALRRRKSAGGAVPLVGGAAVALGCLAGDLGDGALELPWFALVAALCLGGVDDLRREGLGVVAKLAGQVGVALLAGMEGEGGARERLARGGAVLLAQNLVNTFDNADGAAAGTGALALWAAPVSSGSWGSWGALLGFLPWNLVRRGRSKLPHAYLGDAGAHFIGVLCACTPGALVGLWLPALDLARLSIVRWRSGSAPWVGDRRHLAHRLAAAGWGPVRVAGALTAASAGPILLLRLGRGPLGPGPAAALAALLGLSIFVALLRKGADPRP